MWCKSLLYFYLSFNFLLFLQLYVVSQHKILVSLLGKIPSTVQFLLFLVYLVVVDTSNFFAENNIHVHDLLTFQQITVLPKARGATLFACDLQVSSVLLFRTSPSFCTIYSASPSLLDILTNVSAFCQDMDQTESGFNNTGAITYFLHIYLPLNDLSLLALTNKPRTDKW